ncbi:hypothetical protein SANTM175S_03653 [Streptomyces antimycoticus]
MVFTLFMVIPAETRPTSLPSGLVTGTEEVMLTPVTVGKLLMKGRLARAASSVSSYGPTMCFPIFLGLGCVYRIPAVFHTTM